jgi:RNA polymerase sigma-70 factor (family 1)
MIGNDLSNSSDQKLAAQLANGSTVAFKLIYEKYSRKLYTAAFNLLRDKPACEDLIHDLFVDLWTKRDHHHILHLAPYLFLAVKNRVLMHIRSKKINIDISTLDLGSQNDTVEDMLSKKEITNIVNTQLHHLPEKCREIYALSRVENRSHKEIAALKGIAVKTVENQITIALRKLRPSLQDYFLSLLLLYFIL